MNIYGGNVIWGGREQRGLEVLDLNSIIIHLRSSGF